MIQNTKLYIIDKQTELRILIMKKSFKLIKLVWPVYRFYYHPIACRYCYKIVFNTNTISARAELYSILVATQTNAAI